MDYGPEFTIYKERQSVSRYMSLRVVYRENLTRDT